MRAGRLAVLALTWIVASTFAGCATPPEATPPPPEPEPIAAGAAGSHPLVFQKALFRIPAGTPLSVARLRGRIVEERSWEGELQESRTFNVSATDELKRLGYDVRDSSDAVFTPGSTAEARFQIAAIVHDLKLEFDVKPDPTTAGRKLVNVSSSATLQIEFQIFDSVAKRTVSKKRVEGHAVEKARPGAPMPAAFVAGLRRALADPEFVAPILENRPGTAEARAPALEPIPVSRCSLERLKLPPDLPSAQEAVVVVIVGSSSGTGTVISDDGYVLTAAHVVGAQLGAVLRFKSGLELPAEVVRVDAARDAALLKVPGRGHACLRTETKTVGVGTEIWAIGNPIAEELARSVTRGVASGNRTIQDRSYLQTDAAVNPGNSGGPLLDARGRLRGIVVVKLEGSGIEGLAFAVPIADAESALGIAWK
jgi:S1-C subfamily serine protease